MTARTSREESGLAAQLAGPAFVGWATAALVAMTLALLAIYGTGHEGVHVIVRATAGTSVLFFCAAFAASGLRRLWQNDATAWLVRNRRYVGLSFAVSHAIHLAAILTLVATEPGFAEGIKTITIIGGGTAYVLIALMALTSNDTAVRRLGRRRWRALHRVGLWIVFGIFVNSYLGRAVENPNYIPNAALLGVALMIRLWPSRARVD
jgi:sulfoxide reductase heme-binding subunit YedZ